MYVFVSEYVGWVDQGNRMKYRGPYICPLCTMYACVYMCVCFVFLGEPGGLGGLRGYSDPN